MKNKIKAPNIVIIAILTLITIVFWIAFSIIEAVRSPQKVDVPASILNPLDPTLNTDALSSVEQRVFYTNDQIGQTTISLPSPSPTPTETPTATSSASPSPSPAESATQSGTTNNSTGSATTQ